MSRMNRCDPLSAGPQLLPSQLRSPVWKPPPHTGAFLPWPAPGGFVLRMGQEEPKVWLGLVGRERAVPAVREEKLPFTRRGLRGGGWGALHAAEQEPGKVSHHWQQDFSDS